MKNRLGIFVIYDPDGIIGEYRHYMLQDMIKNLSELVIVCNGDIIESELESLRAYTSQVYVRDNKGFDAGALKEALCEYIGWDKVADYDEVVFFNDSFYGPFYPFEVMFDEMDSRNVDFWGITSHTGIKYGVAKIPVHIQSYFYVVRKRMLNSDAFKFFWVNLDTDSFIFPDDAVTRYELKFTNYFANQGFRWDVYVDTSNAYFNKALNNTDPRYYSYILISEFKCPIIKRKYFCSIDGYADLSIDSASCVLEYIHRHTRYDTGLIWRDLLRRHSLFNILISLNLYFVLPLNKAYTHDVRNKKLAVIIVIESHKQLERYSDDILNIPQFIDIYISAEDHEICRILAETLGQRDNIRLVPSWSLPYAECFLKYDYICYIHDRNEMRDRRAFDITGTYGAWHNALVCEEYILNVVDTFEKNPCLGLLSVPFCYGNDYFDVLRKARKDTKSAFSSLNELGFRIKTDSYDQLCLNLDLFWFRTSALHPLFRRKSKEFDLNTQRYAYPFIAQHEGYYSGILMTTEYAKIEISNKSAYLSATCNIFWNDEMHFDESTLVFYRSIKKLVERNKLNHVRSAPIYLYGAGEYGMLYYSRLKDREVKVSGFIVSDGHKKTEKYLDIPVYELSEVVKHGISCSVIIAVGNTYYQEIYDALEKAGLDILN